MRIPLNMFHWYIGLPVVFFFATRGLLSARKTKNKITFYLGMSGLIFTFCLASYGLPPLFTTNSQILTTTTILGDILQFVALWVMWMAVARIYAPNNAWVRRTIVVVDFFVVLLGAYFSLTENLTTPVTMTQIANGTWQINFAFSQGYEIVTAIQYVSLILIAAKFWSQAKGVTNKRQIWRLRSIAIGFFIVGCSYILRLFATSSTYSVSMSAIIALGLAIAGMFMFATSILEKSR